MDALTIIFIILGFILAVVGIVGCIVPGLPGPPLNYIAVVLLDIAKPELYTSKFLLWFGLVVVIVYFLDYILPVLGAKIYNASKYGIWGSIIGMIIGIFFFPPFGMILGIIIGTITGELLAGKEHSEALKVGFVTFIASMTVIIIKLSLSLILTFYFLKGVFTIGYGMF